MNVSISGGIRDEVAKEATVGIAGSSTKIHDTGESRARDADHEQILVQADVRQMPYSHQSWDGG
jgi:hypothetical protein